MATDPPAPPPAYQLDGHAITDRVAFYTALGAALNGPGGYYGSNLDALADCLHGGFGPAPPFTLVWRDAGTARRHLTGTVVIGGRRLSYFDAILDTLRTEGVAVELR
ncbi:MULTISPECIES: barstar family protein [unclassified Kitasatospora]|uniref:barstar family protein n=1 Tax=unclassified Kitasatospora TaxID=2633591 RepID=UPI002E376AE1|nr:barstar family protein [Kitasatospora sp. NBC_01246]